MNTVQRPHDVATANSNISTSEGPICSSEFPQGYGDFMFKSVDGTMFHVPRFLLACASPVFNDMFDLGDRTEKEVLILQESRETLECLLCHIHPGKETPPFKWEGIAEVLAAADKYQIKKILPWFEKEVMAEVNATSPPAMKEPILCLHLASRYKLEMPARMALRQLIKCHISVTTAMPGIDGRSMAHLFSLRAARTQIFMDFIFKWWGGGTNISPCRLHSNTYLGWARNSAAIIINEPSWDAMFSTRVFPPQQGCTCKPPDFSIDVKDWAIKLENELPALPSKI